MNALGNNDSEMIEELWGQSFKAWDFVHLDELINIILTAGADSGLEELLSSIMKSYSTDVIINA